MPELDVVSDLTHLAQCLRYCFTDRLLAPAGAGSEQDVSAGLCFFGILERHDADYDPIVVDHQRQRQARTMRESLAVRQCEGRGPVGAFVKLEAAPRAATGGVRQLLEINVSL